MTGARGGPGYGPLAATQPESGPAPETLPEGAPDAGGERARVSGGFPEELADRYRALKRLQPGGQAEIWRVEDLEHGDVYVVKVYDRWATPDEKVLDRLKKLGPECEPHVVPVREHGRLSDGRVYEVQEYIEHGTLRDLIGSDDSEPPDDTSRVRDALVQLRDALGYIHGHDLQHQDLKPKNVFVRSEDPLDIVLGDFGTSSLASDTMRVTKRKGMTIAYAAPELFSGREVILKEDMVDWWSVGIIVVEMLTGKHPLPSDERGIHHFFLTRSTDDLAEGVKDANWRKLCRGLLRSDPEKRWGFEESGKWLDNPADPELQVADEEAPRQQFFRFVGNDYAASRDLADALAADWESAGDIWTESYSKLREWVLHTLGNKDVASQLHRIHGADLGLDEQLFLAIRALGRETPSFRGVDITEGNLAILALEAATVPGGHEAEVLRDLRESRVLVEADRYVEPLGPWAEATVASWDRAIRDYEKLHRTHEMRGLPLGTAEETLLIAAATPGSDVPQALRGNLQDNLEKYPLAKDCYWFQSLDSVREAEPPTLLAMTFLAEPAHAHVEEERRREEDRRREEAWGRAEAARRRAEAARRERQQRREEELRARRQRRATFGRAAAGLGLGLLAGGLHFALSIPLVGDAETGFLWLLLGFAVLGGLTGLVGGWKNERTAGGAAGGGCCGVVLGVPFLFILIYALVWLVGKGLSLVHTATVLLAGYGLWGMLSGVIWRSDSRAIGIPALYLVVAVITYAAVERFAVQGAEPEGPQEAPVPVEPEPGPPANESDVASDLEDLLGRPVSPNARDANGWTDLHHAAALNLPEIARDLLQAGAAVDARFNPIEDGFQVFSVRGGMEEFPRGPASATYCLWLADAKYGPPFRSALTPLHLAASFNAPVIVEELLERGADIDARDDYGSTPLHYASSTGLVVSYFLDRGADVNARNDGGSTPLYFAAAAAWAIGPENVLDLLDRGAAVNARDEDGETPLHAAIRGSPYGCGWRDPDARGGAPEAVSTLLDRGADMEARDSEGNTPLQIAVIEAERGSRTGGLLTDPVATAVVLLERGADVHARSDAGRTAMELAGEHEEMRALLRRYGSRRAEDELRKSVADLAERSAQGAFDFQPEHRDLTEARACHGRRGKAPRPAAD